MERLLNFRPEPFPELDHAGEERELDLDTLSAWATRQDEGEIGRRRKRRSASAGKKVNPRPAVGKLSSGLLGKRPPNARAPLRVPPRLPEWPWRVASTTVVGIPFIPLRDDAPPSGRQVSDTSRADSSGSPATPEPKTDAGSERVRWVQACLNRALGLDLVVDGIMGPQTRSALRLFQRKHGLPMTGLVGPDTEAVLTTACASGNRGRTTGLPSRAELDEFDEVDPARDDEWLTSASEDVEGARPRSQGAPSGGTATAVRTARTRNGRAIDLQRAASLNRKSSIELGWIDYASSIRDLLGLSACAPSEAEFARAVAAWQEKRGGLRTDGVIDRATLEAMRPAHFANSFAGLDPRHALDATPTNTLLTQLREVAFDSSAADKDEIERFVTVKLGITPEGHELLTRIAARTFKLSKQEQNALKDGVRAPDQVPLWTQLKDPQQPRRHANRRTYEQGQAQALHEIRGQLYDLYTKMFSQPTRAAALQTIGEALHLIQDSYCPAHVERQGAGETVSSRHLINYIRYYGPGHSSPKEHGFPMDSRDFIKRSGSALYWTREAIRASREFLALASKHLAARRLAPAEVLRFLDRHFVLNPIRSRPA